MRRLLVLLLISSNSVFGQVLDSLYQKLDDAKSDSVKITTLLEISQFVYEESVEEDLKINDRIIKLSSQGLKSGTNEIFYLHSLITAYEAKGYDFRELGKLRFSIDCYDKQYTLAKRAFSITKSDDDRMQIGNALIALGTVHGQMSEIESALDYTSRGLYISKQLKDSVFYAEIYGNLAFLYVSKGRNSRSQDEKQRLFQKGLYYNKRSLSFSILFGDQIRTADTYNNIAGLYSSMDVQDSVLHYFEKCERIYRLMNFAQGEVVANAGIAKYYLEVGSIDNALNYAQRSFDIAEELNSPVEMESPASILYRVWKLKGNRKKALYYFEKFHEAKDAVNNDDNRRALLKQKAEFDYRFKEENFEREQRISSLEISSQKAKLDKQEILQKQERNTRIALILGLIVLLSFAFFIVSRLRITRKQKAIIEDQKEAVETQNEIIENKNQEIVDSIVYAKRLQEAIFPSKENITSLFKDAFIMYQPKDIVAGDFYWKQSSGDIHYLCAADCTGHGVPGALVSIVCANGLDQALQKHGFNTSTGEILDEVSKMVSKRFEISGTNVRDGMDIALIRIDIKEQEFQFSGAHNPCVLVRGESIEIVKGDRRPVGNFEDGKPFKTTVVPFETHDWIYLFTDGFYDQFGGDKGKKYKSLPFRNFLQANSDKDGRKQHDLLVEEFKTWSEGFEQIDDVCVMGIQL